MTNLEDKKNKVLTHLNQLEGTKLLIVGDIGLDEYVNGAVKRISPEAPVPVVDVAKKECRLGLATNVAQNIQALGGQAILISVIGEDEIGQELSKLLEDSGVSAQYLLRDTTRPTTRKLRVMSGHHHIVRVDYEMKHYLSKEMESKLLGQVKANISSVDGVILQDYAKGVLSQKLIQDVLKVAKENNKKVLVDPHKSTPLSNYKGADLMTPNFDEAIVLAGYDSDLPHNDEDELMHLGKDLMNGIGSENMIITRSQHGMSLFEKNETKRVPTFARKVSDVTGAGDTVIAAIALGWASGFSLEESCVLANYAAGVVVGKIGCATCDTKELISYIESHSVS